MMISLKTLDKMGEIILIYYIVYQYLLILKKEKKKKSRDINYLWIKKINPIEKKTIM